MNLIWSIVDIDGGFLFLTLKNFSLVEMLTYSDFFFITLNETILTVFCFCYEGVVVQ